MYRRILVISTFLLIGVPSISTADDARAILETAHQKQLQRWTGVEAYLVEQSLMGNRTQTLFQRTELEDASGGTRTAFLPVSSGLPGKCMGDLQKAFGGAGGSQMSATSDPQAMRRFMDSARLVGTETVDGRAAYHLHVDDLGEVQKADGNEYRIHTIDLWLDSKEYVPLRMLMEGTMVSGRETRPITIENVQTDYRTVPGSTMYESFKQTMQINGMMDAEQQAQMREAQAKMEQFEQQLADMPAGQRKMMEKMMGSQLEMVKNMAAGGGLQTEIITQSIVVNPAMRVENGQPCPAFAAGVTPATQVTSATHTPSATQIPSVAQAVPDQPAIASDSDPAAMKAAQQACLQQKVDAAQRKQKKKRGLRGLLKVVGRSASRFGNSDLSQATKDIYDVDVTAGELAVVAKDLGLSDDDVAACRNPQ